jgi:hypothetical protein
MLGEGYSAIRTVSIYLDTQELDGATKVMKFEVLGELGYELVDGSDRF